MRTNYEMTEADFATLIAAMKPVSMIMLQCGTPRSVQENANAAWALLGEKMGFDPMTVAPNGKGDRFFSAVAMPEDEEPEWQSDVQAAFGGIVQTPQG